MHISDKTLPILAGVGAVAAATAYLVSKDYNDGPRPRAPPSHGPECYSEYKMNEKVATSSPDDDLPIRLAKSGLAAKTPQTIIEVFEMAKNLKGDKDALKVERDGSWKTWTWKQYYDDCMKAAKSLMAIGLDQFEGVAIIGFNSPEWFISNMAAIAAGGMAAGIYTTNEKEACQYIADHCKARVVVAEGEKQLAKFLAVKNELPLLKAIVVYNGAPTEAQKAQAGSKLQLFSWEEFLAAGSSISDEILRLRTSQLKPNQCSTLIYTSGTTGPPKAVMLSHDNITFTASVASNALLPPGVGEGSEHLISYLPLSHVAGQLIDMHFPMYATASMKGSVTVWFARPDALRGSLGDTMKAVRPTLFFGVPRVWEKIQEKMMAIGAKTTGVKKSVVTWAKAHGLATTQQEELGGTGRKSFGFMLANKLLLSKVHEALGLDRCKFCCTGAAPISKETLDYFGALHIPIFELFGMSESTAIVSGNTVWARRFGSCGAPIQGCEVKIMHENGRDKPGEGEICFRGRNIMMGYLYSEDKTKEAIDSDGWLHSGDVGRLDKDGMLYITGRIKELIITAGGENIPPVPIEESLKTLLPAISQAMVIGDRRKFLAVLLTLKTEPKSGDAGLFTDMLTAEAKTVDPMAKTVADAKASAAWSAYIQKGIDTYNKTQAVSNAQRVQKFVVLEEEFTTATGELTPTLKLRRPAVVTKYEALIESIYQGSAE